MSSSYEVFHFASAYARSALLLTLIPDRFGSKKGGAVVMSALGHEQTSRHVRVMSVIPLKADIHQRGLHVRLVPTADI